MNKYTADEIVNLIDSLGLSREDAATAMGVTYACLHSWTSGRRKISDANVDLMLAKHLLKGADVYGDQNREYHRKIFT